MQSDEQPIIVPFDHLRNPSDEERPHVDRLVDLMKGVMLLHAYGSTERFMTLYHVSERYARELQWLVYKATPIAPPDDGRPRPARRMDGSKIHGLDAWLADIGASLGHTPRPRRG